MEMMYAKFHTKPCILSKLSFSSIKVNDILDIFQWSCFLQLFGDFGS